LLLQQKKKKEKEKSKSFFEVKMFFERVDYTI